MSMDVLRRAAAGELPDWTEASPRRRAHMDRVASLMGQWAEGLDLDETDRVRWVAAGRLHDVLRDATSDTLAVWTPESFRDLPEPFLHGPAAAHRLEVQGLRDDAVLEAIRYHTLGHEALDIIGRALIAADFLEPGRKAWAQWRERQRARMPHELDGVLQSVIRARLGRGLESGTPLRHEMVGLWNTLVAS
jgi:HD superfamily phosphohydrolase YqeK